MFTIDQYKDWPRRDCQAPGNAQAFVSPVTAWRSQWPADFVAGRGNIRPPINQVDPLL